MDDSTGKTPQDVSGDDGYTELCLPWWLEVLHTSATAVTEVRDACAANDDNEPSDEEFLASGHRVYLTGLWPPFTPIRTDNTCRDCGGQRWFFKQNEGCLSEHRALLTGHNRGCSWFHDFIAKALLEGALSVDGEFVPEAERAS